MKGYIFNIQRFSLHDGPGIRTNVFFKGCPLKCIWCHNPEGISMYPQIEYTPDKCIGCGDCVKICPSGAHNLIDGMHKVDFKLCKSCMKCAEVCPSGAIEAIGTILSAEQVICEVMKDKSFYETSGGGITLSGGEPFFQGDFALEILKLAKKNGLHTAVETSGMVAPDIIKKSVEVTDLFLFDYKASDPKLHKKVTGADQNTILDNLKHINSANAKIILRCPIIPGINDNEKHYSSIADIACNHLSIEEINLMPYHSLGVGKRTRIGEEILFKAEPMDKDKMECIRLFIEKKCAVPVKVM